MSPEPFDDHSPGHDMPEAGVESKTSSVETAPTAVLTGPGFLHPSSIVFEVLSHVRQFIIPAIIGVVTAAQGSMWGMGFAAVVFAGSLLATLLRYFTLRYRIQDHDFVVTEGLLFRARAFRAHPPHSKHGLGAKRPASHLRRGRGEYRNGFGH